MQCKYASICKDKNLTVYLCNNQSEALKYCTTYVEIKGYRKIK